VVKLMFVGLVLSLLSGAHVCAEPVGEAHRLTSEKTASLRDAQHRNQLRITVWYPAAADSVEHTLTVGPPDKPLFNIDSAASDAAFAVNPARWPVILLSHPRRILASLRDRHAGPPMMRSGGWGGTIYRTSLP
jgi:hypothetical protein